MKMNQAEFLVVIPARYESSRFPGKPLALINGVPMIKRTYEQCLLACSSDKVLVATDSPEIEDYCIQNRMNVMLTGDSHLTGTDRLCEVASKVDAEFYINVQGDEPLANPEDIRKAIHAAVTTRKDVLNGYCEIINEDMFRSTAVPKCVVSLDNRLLYMSRSAIPGAKDGVFKKGWRQVCIYSFSKFALEQFYAARKKTPMEEIEDIEIIRFLEIGFTVHMLPMSSNSIAVDYPGDVDKVEIELLRRGLM